MYFNKYPLRQNFSFANGYHHEQGFTFGKGESRPVTRAEYGNNIFRLVVGGKNWEDSSSQAVLHPIPLERENEYRLELGEDGTVRLTDLHGAPLLDSFPGETFGRNGQASMFRFAHRPGYRYYGGGSKMIGLEYTGKRSKFWNTDAFADFGQEILVAGRPDPYYISVPYLIVKTPHGWVGLLYNNSEAAFFSVAAEVEIEGFAKVDTGDGRSVNLGSESGQPDLFILAAPSLEVLTQNFQQLVGTVPLPPLWALGYQQCRWGYESTAQLRDLDNQFAEHAIPVDGLWLDIDYMDGFRVFTTHPEKNPGSEARIHRAARKRSPRHPDHRSRREAQSRLWRLRFRQSR